jgi:hypothetical protein
MAPTRLQNDWGVRQESDKLGKVPAKRKYLSVSVPKNHAAPAVSATGEDERSALSWIRLICAAATVPRRFRIHRRVRTHRLSGGSLPAGFTFGRYVFDSGADPLIRAGPPRSRSSTNLYLRGSRRGRRLRIRGSAPRSQVANPFRRLQSHWILPAFEPVVVQFVRKAIFTGGFDRRRSGEEEARCSRKQ